MPRPKKPNYEKAAASLDSLLANPPSQEKPIVIYVRTNFEQLEKLLQHYTPAAIRAALEKQGIRCTSVELVEIYNQIAAESGKPQHEVPRRKSKKPEQPESAEVQPAPAKRSASEKPKPTQLSLTADREIEAAY